MTLPTTEDPQMYDQGRDRSSSDRLFDGVDGRIRIPAALEPAQTADQFLLSVVGDVVVLDFLASQDPDPDLVTARSVARVELPIAAFHRIAAGLFEISTDL